MTRASASFSVRPVTVTPYATAVATHSRASFWWTSTSTFTRRKLTAERDRGGSLVAPGQDGVARGLVGDRVAGLGGHGAGHAHGAHDRTLLDERDRAATEHEPIVAERRHVVGEELASLAEALLEVLRRGAERRRGVGLRARDLGRHPERAVHAGAGDEVPRLVHHGDRDLEAERLGLGEAALDARPGPRQRERHGRLLRGLPPRPRRLRRGPRSWRRGGRARAGRTRPSGRRTSNRATDRRAGRPRACPRRADRPCARKRPGRRRRRPSRAPGRGGARSPRRASAGPPERRPGGPPGAPACYSSSFSTDA